MFDQLSKLLTASKSYYMDWSKFLHVFSKFLHEFVVPLASFLTVVEKK